MRTPLLRGVAALGVVLLTAGGGALSAQAAPVGVSHAEGRFLSGSLLQYLNLSAVAGINGEQASSTGAVSQTNSSNLGLGALGNIVSVGIPGGVQLPVDFVNAGVVGQYASALTDGTSVGASGLIDSSGAIGTGITPAPGVAPGPMTFHLQNLLGPSFTSSISGLDLTLDALSAQATATTGGTPTGAYDVAGASLDLSSPAIAGISGTVNSAVGTLQTDVNALAGSNGGLANGVVGAVGGVLGAVSVGSASASVTVNLSSVVAPILAAPLNSGDGVSIDLSTGKVHVDLALLNGSLNGLAPNTEVISAATLTAIDTRVASLVNGLVAQIDTAVTNALNAATVSVDVSLNAPGPIPLVDVTVNGTLKQISDGTATVGITALGALPIVGLNAGVILTALKPVVDAVISPTAPSSLATFTSGLTTNVVDPVVNGLNPAIAALDTVVSLLANVQTPTPPVQGAMFTETALRLGLLQTGLLPQALELNLATAVVGPNALTPGLTALTPNQGPTAGGTAVQITGTDLAAATQVTIDGVSVPFTQVSSTQVDFTTPAHPVSGPVPVVVTTPGGASNPLTFTYVPAPALTSLTPPSGPVAGGTTVTITGTDLGGASAVTIGGTSVVPATVTPTQVTFVTPAHLAGAVGVTVTTPGGTSGPLTYTYVPAPAATSLNPSQGPTAGGQTVTITGTDLGGASAVTIGGTSVAPVTVTPTQVTFVTPAHVTPGAVSVTVTTPGGVSNPLTYTYVAAPALTSLTPPSGPVAGGTTVTITGTDLAGASAVTIGGASVVPTAVTPTQVTFVTPAGLLPGPVNVTVTTPGGVSNPLTYTYLAVPALTALSPDQGPVAGGTTVTITGTGLAGASAVSVDNVPVAIFTPVDDSTVTFVTPAHLAGAASVTVTTPGGVGAPLTYTYVPVPSATSLNPDQGPAAGGTTVTITGIDLVGASAVTIGGTSVVPTSVTPTQVTFVTPAHPAGAVDVTVTTPGGTSLPLTYTYVAAPVLTALAPDHGPTAGGTALTITGTNLAAATQVTMDGAAVPFTQVSATEITLTTPAHAAGPVPVVVTTAGGASTPKSFTYVPPIVLTSLSPGHGPETGGTTVTISGSGLSSTTGVTVGGASVPFTVANDGSITIVTPAHAPGGVQIVVSNPLGSAQLPFTYDAVTSNSGSAKGGMASTGFDVVPPVLLAALALLAGVVLVVRRRRGLS